MKALFCTLFLSTIIIAHNQLQQLGDSICVDCVNLMFDNEYTIDDIINGGASDCDQLCQTLYNQTGDKQALQACSALCNKVGIKKLTTAIKRGGNNPYNVCELIKICKTNDHGDAKIISMKMPSVIEHGKHFNVTMTFKTVNGTSAGRTITYVNPPDSTEPHPLTNSTILDALPPGTYSLTWYYMAKYDPNCTEHQCWDWPLGNYNVQVVLCSGQCWLEPPNNFVYDGRQLNFTVIKGNFHD